MEERLADILSSYPKERRALIPLLQSIQEEFGYIPEEGMSRIADYLGLSLNQVYGVASFYAQFRFTRPGKYVVKVCLGTACHVRGGEHILEAVERELGIKRGETTQDYKFSLERVACFGCCALAPVMVTGKSVHGKMTRFRVREVIKRVEQEGKSAE